MALILIDGMEDRSTFAQTASTISIVAGRHGNCLRGDIASAATYTLKSAEESDYITFGCAVRFSSLATSGDYIRFGSDAGGTIHLYLHMLVSGGLGTFRLLSGAPATLVTGTTNFAAVNTWYYVEVQVRLHDTLGFAIMRINGTQQGSTFNGDTKNAGTKIVYDTVRLTNNIIGNIDYDDLYLKGGAGETFMGDITVETLYPNGNGNANQWVGSDADSVNNYLLVNETGNPNTASYVKSATAGEIDEYTMTDLVGTGSIVAVCHHASVALAAAGSQTFAFVNRRTTDTVGTTLTCVSISYGGFHQPYTVDPETGAAWTITNVNALQSGIKVI